MNTNIKLELTDAQRVTLQQQLTGKQRPLSRLELREFVEGCVSGALDCEEVNVKYNGAQEGIETMPTQWSDMYSAKSEHWRTGWLRGWNVVGNRLGK